MRKQYHTPVSLSLSICKHHSQDRAFARAPHEMLSEAFNEPVHFMSISCARTREFAARQNPEEETHFMRYVC